MEKRVLLAIFLIAVVLVLSNLFLSPPKPEKIAPLGEKEVVDEAEEKERESLEETGTGGQEVPLMTGVVAEGDTIIVETDIYRLGISSVGGRLISMELKEYSSYMNDGGVRLIPPRNSSFLNMRVTLEQDTLDLGKLDFSPSTAHIHAAEETKVLVLAHPVGRGDSIKMKYTFNPGVYVIDIELFLPGTIWKRDRQLQVDLLPRLLPTELDSVRNDINYFGTIMGRERGGVEKVDIGDLDGEKDATAYNEGPFLWAGIKNKYFVAALVARNAPLKGVISKGAEKENRIGITAILPPGEKEGEFRWTVYLGPQDYYRLSALGVGLEDIVEYGWWIIRPFTRMIVVILLWMHQFIRNYGVVIIVFSVMTKVAFYPLTQKSMKATQDLQRIQPMMKELREKHKKDPQKLQQETMRLYREHKVNPLGGCLPMIVQMPVLWALFYVFRMTIEFRGAEFVLWIKDLSAPDSPPVLPIVMGLSMFLQQKLAPQNPDPKMAPMMYVMPVVLTFIFINFPAGLVLYWTINNLLAIAQQYMIKRNLGAAAPVKKEPAPKPA